MLEYSKYIKKNSLINRAVLLFSNLFFTIIRKIIKHKKVSEGKIAIVTLHRLGDTVFTIPSIKALKKVFDKRLVVVCHEESKKIYEIVFEDLEYLILKKEDFYLGGRIANFKSRKKLKDLLPSIILDITGGINSATLIFNSHAARIAGFNKDYYRKIFTDFIQPRKLPHLIDMYLDAAKLLIKIDNEKEIKYFSKSINRNGYILIHPYAGWNSKEWDFNKFIELYNMIVESNECKFILPIERIDKKILSMFKSKNISYIISEDINKLINSIKNAKMVIGCDSGAVYIASLLGKPTFTIYGPTNPRFSLPFGEHHDYIFKKMEYSPKYNEQYGYGLGGYFAQEIDFMQSISTKEVYDKIKKLLNKLDL